MPRPNVYDDPASLAAALPVIRICAPEAGYDYENKYFAEAARAAVLH